VAAPSGAGKTTLCKALLERIETEGGQSLQWSISYTTRKKRAGEENGRDYFFIDDQAFDRMIEADDFVEWAKVHGRRYGTSRHYLEQALEKGHDLLVEIDTQGARQLKDKLPGACFIFILPPDWGALEKRLTGRGTEGEEEVKRRLTRAHQEILAWSWFDYIIVNDEFEAAVDDMSAVVKARRLVREHVAPVVESIFPDAIGPNNAVGDI